MRKLIAALWIGACGPQPTPTGAVCPSPDPMTLGYTAADTPGCTGTADECNFGKTFMDHYCINCHNSMLTRSQRHGAPLYHDFDTLLGVLEVAGHIDQQAGFGPNAQNTFMPGDRCPSVPGGPIDENCSQPTAHEREQLAVWLACERDREHMF
jgi:hypothetical protein